MGFKMIANIYKAHYGDCSNNGISARNDCVMVVSPEYENTNDWTGENVCVIRERNVYGKRHVYLVPFKLRDRHTMFGGCFVYSSDSRFPENRPLPLHDRVE